MSRQWAQKKSGSNSSMPVQKSSSKQQPSSNPIYDAPAPKQTPSVQAKRPVDWSRVTVEAPSRAGVQAKLTVGAPGDKYEQEADSMAAKVMTMPAPGSEQPIQREMAPEEKQEEVQTKPLAASITPLVQREMAPEENKQEEVQTKLDSGNIQRETAPEENKEEEVQAKSLPGSIQRETAPEENKEEEVQAKSLPGSIQRETAPEENKEEEVQTKPHSGSIQREMAPEENKEEEVQTKPHSGSIQRETAPEENKEEEVQAKPVVGSIQREMAPEENKQEEVQAKSLPGSIQRETAPEENKQEEVQAKSLPNSIQRETAPEENKEEEVQAKPAPEGKSQNSSNVESQLSASKGGGSPLSDEVRAFMEPRFGADFSSVKVHTDGAAVQMNKELGAQAFAHGSDIYYGAGKSPGNNELTAHELTHVVQQTGGVRLQPQKAEDQAAKVAKMNADFDTYVQKEDWKQAALVLNGFAMFDILPRVAKINSGQLDNLKNAADENMKGWHPRVQFAVEVVKNSAVPDNLKDQINSAQVKDAEIFLAAKTGNKETKKKKGNAAVLEKVKQYDEYIKEASKQYGISVEQIRSIIAIESGGNPEATSGAAWGLMQLTKDTWKGTQQTRAELKDYDFDTYWKDPKVNILFGTAALKAKMGAIGVKSDNPNFAKLAVVAYNAGEGTVKKAIALAKKNGSTNPENDCLKPEYLKPAIKSTKIHSYYLTGAGRKRNPQVKDVTADPNNKKKKVVVPKEGSTIEQAEEVAIDLKYQEISQYPEKASSYMQLQASQK